MARLALPAPFTADLKVIVPAGGDPAPPNATVPPGTPLSGKAFLPLRGQLLVEYVLDFLRECGLRRIWVVAAEDQLTRIPSRHAFVGVPQPPGTRFFDNLLAGCHAAQPRPGEPVLVVFGDHPFNTTSALQLFLERSAAMLDEADFFHAMALQASYREYRQWFHRTSVHMREMSGRATGLSLAVPSRLHGVSKFQALYGVRKLERPSSFFRLLQHLAQWLGADAAGTLRASLLMYLAKEMEKGTRREWAGAQVCRRLEAALSNRLPVERMQRYAGRVLEAERGVRFIPIAHGGLAIDVDFSEELETIERHWDAIQEIAARQEARLAAQLRSPTVTA